MTTHNSINMLLGIIRICFGVLIALSPTMIAVPAGVVYVYFLCTLFNLDHLLNYPVALIVTLLFLSLFVVPFLLGLSLIFKKNFFRILARKVKQFFKKRYGGKD